MIASPTAHAGELHAPRAETILDLDGVLTQVLMSRTAWLNGVKTGKYPQALYLSPRRPRWKQSSIDALIAAL